MRSIQQLSCTHDCPIMAFACFSSNCLNFTFGYGRPPLVMVFRTFLHQSWYHFVTTVTGQFNPCFQHWFIDMRVWHGLAYPYKQHRWNTTVRTHPMLGIELVHLLPWLPHVLPSASFLPNEVLAYEEQLNDTKQCVHTFNFCCQTG